MTTNSTPEKTIRDELVPILADFGTDAQGDQYYSVSENEVRDYLGTETIDDIVALFTRIIEECKPALTIEPLSDMNKGWNNAIHEFETAIKERIG